MYLATSVLMQIPSNVRVIEGSWIARCAAWYMRTKQVAMVINHRIHLWGVTKQDFLANNRWVKHELKHVEQYAKKGTVPFLLAYTWEWIRHGYFNNKFEIEARAAESI
jgi:hypothetical protein